MFEISKTCGVKKNLGMNHVQVSVLQRSWSRPISLAVYREPCNYGLGNGPMQAFSGNGSTLLSAHVNIPKIGHLDVQGRADNVYNDAQLQWTRSVQTSLCYEGHACLLHARCVYASSSLNFRCTFAACSQHVHCTFAARPLHVRCTLAAR